MRKVSDLAERNNFTTGDRRSFVWSISFSAWIPDEVNEQIKFNEKKIILLLRL